MVCICSRVVSAISAGQPSARAATAILSMTRSRFFSLSLTISVRQVDMASNADFTALRASSDSPGANIGLKVRELTSANLVGMTCLLSPTNENYCQQRRTTPRAEGQDGQEMLHFIPRHLKLDEGPTAMRCPLLRQEGTF